MWKRAASTGPRASWCGRVTICDGHMTVASPPEVDAGAGATLPIHVLLRSHERNKSAAIGSIRQGHAWPQASRSTTPVRHVHVRFIRERVPSSRYVQRALEQSISSHPVHAANECSSDMQHPGEHCKIVKVVTVHYTIAESQFRTASPSSACIYRFRGKMMLARAETPSLCTIFLRSHTPLRPSITAINSDATRCA